MAIKWKSPDRFKPAYILERIASVRSVSEDGKASYSGLMIDECMPTLHSMLTFPPAAAELEHETLVWRALSRVGKELTPGAFLHALNQVLNEKLATRESNYIILTTISLDPTGLPRKFKLLNCEIELRSSSYAKKFSSRQNIIKIHRTNTSETPINYCNIVAKIRAKSDGAAFHKAMKAIDLLRALICLMANSRMQFTFGTHSLEPINAVRLGVHHTVHLSDGKSARDGFWYEPNFIPTTPHKFDKPDIVSKNIRWAIRKIENSNFKLELVASLLRFVRGMDQNDHNSAFLKLWSALELLTTPHVADYDKLIRRSAFLFKENEYHRQVLEHLRAYRNSNVHAGEESDNARVHCFQLQTYYFSIAWFCIRNSSQFTELGQMGEFLDLPPKPEELQARLRLLKRAIKFTSPK